MTTSIDVRGQRPEIARSWQRCELAGLDPESAGRPSYADVDDASRLMVAAAPVLTDLAELLDGNAFSLVLVDRTCRLAHLWGGEHRFLDVIDSYGVTVGVDLAEASFGTTAMGTAMETGQSVVVHGAEHYLEPFKVLSCYGSPIRHPLTRRLEGVLDITSLGPTSNPLFGPLVERAAQDIRTRLLDGARESQRRLFLAFQHATRYRSVPVAVLGGDIVLANRACLDLLGTADAAILRTLLPQTPTRRIVSRELDVGPAGRVAVTAERIEGTPDGVLFLLGPPAAPDLVAPAAGTPATGRSVLVAGEPGTGRTRAAREVAGDGPVVTIDATAAVTGSAPEWANRLVGLASRHSGVVIVEDVHVLGENLCTVLRRAMSSARVRFVLTSCPVDELPRHVERVVARCVRRIEVAPLRERVHELPALISELGAAIRPDRSWSLTPRALDVLAAQPWAGNLAELAALVEYVADRPGSDRVDVADLPERYRAPARTGLGGRERAERAAIVQALRHSGGNKVRAAERLGISRTTLYRRMQALKVPEGA